MLLPSRRKSKIVFDILTHLILIIGSLISIFPFVWMIVSAFKPTEEIFAPNFWPTRFALEHFIQIFKTSRFDIYFKNSLIVCFFLVTLGLIFDSMGGFALAKGKFPGRNKLLWLIVSTLMIPVYTTLVPSFIIMSTLHLTNTLSGLIIPGISSAVGIFIMTQNIKTVPDALIDAARIDGCSLFGIYLHVILPVVRPALGALAILRFMGSWNSYLWPLILITEETKKTIPLGLASLIYQHGIVRWGATMAGSVVGTLPIIIFFLLMQKQFIRGITLGSIKG